MASVNTIIIVGRLARDPESKMTSGGKQVANFSLAVDEGRGENKRTVWFACTAWDRDAKFLCDYAGKGDPIYVQGRHVSREYEKDGVKKTAWDVQVERLQIVSGKRRDDGESRTSSGAPFRPDASGYEAPTYGDPNDDGCVPF